MKEKRDCKECGKPLKDWQVKNGYELCQECYGSSRRKVSKPAEGSEEVKKECVTEENLGENDERLEC